MSSDRPAVTDGATVSASLTDFDQLAAAFTGWQGRFEQLSSGRFEATLHAVRGRAVRAIEVRANQSILLRGRSASEVVTAHLVTRANAGGTWQGRRLDPGQVVVIGPGGEVDHRSQKRSEYAGVSLPAAALVDAARVLHRTDQIDAPGSWAVLSPPPARVDALDRALRRLFAGGGGASAGAAEERGRVEQDCLRALVEVVVPPSAAARRSVPPLAARAALARRADDLMRARLSAPLGAIDLCGELGVSDRTLRLAFRERFGVGPMVYYKALRLNAVRAALKSSPALAVAGAAEGYGFHHLGNFAADYRRLFGELPSATATARRRGGPAG